MIKALKYVSKGSYEEVLKRLIDGEKVWLAVSTTYASDDNFPLVINAADLSINALHSKMIEPDYLGYFMELSHD